MKPRIRDMRPSDAPAVSLLADELIGPGYYPAERVRETLALSTVGDIVCSHVATVDGRVVAFRFALPPGRWSKGRGDGLSPDLWPVDLADCAYFQSSYVAFEHRGRGIGPAMAGAAEAALVGLNAQAIVTHSWKESPDNSSFRYLAGLGFTAVTEYPKYWSEVDYVCWLDGAPCQCTAIEMIKVVGQLLAER